MATLPWRRPCFDRSITESEPFRAEVTLATIYSLKAYKACADYRVGKLSARADAEVVAVHRMIKDPAMISWMFFSDRS